MEGLLQREADMTEKLKDLEDRRAKQDAEAAKVNRHHHQCGHHRFVVSGLLFRVCCLGVAVNAKP